MNREALARTAELGEAVYWSRSRQRLWRKGEESGHVQKVRELRLDCDNDVVLLKVEQTGAEPGRAGDRLPHRPALVLLPAAARRPLAGRRSGLERSGADLQIARWRAATSNDTLARLAAVIEARRGADPATSYVARLLAKGPDAVLKKIGEEATEVVMACKDGDAGPIVAEVADLWFHTMVALAAARPRAGRRARRARAPGRPVGAGGVRGPQDAVKRDGRNMNESSMLDRRDRGKTIGPRDPDARDVRAAARRSWCLRRASSR